VIERFSEDGEKIILQRKELGPPLAPKTTSNDELMYQLKMHLYFSGK